MELIKLTALRPLSGPYGRPNPGQEFTTDSDTAEELEAQGLAERYRPPSTPKMQPATYENKMLRTHANKRV